MKLKCKINEKQYDKIVSGATFTEEFNETLDSGTINLSHVKRIKDLKPYDDVFVYNSNEQFNGYINKGDVVAMETTVEHHYSWNSGSVSIFPLNNQNNISITNDDVYFYISGTCVNIWKYFFFNFTTENEDNCRFLVDILFDITHETGEVDEGGNPITTVLQNRYIGSSLGNKHGTTNDQLKLFSSIGAEASLPVYFNFDTNVIAIPRTAVGGQKYITSISISNGSYVQRKGAITNTYDIYMKELPAASETDLFVLSFFINGKYYDYRLQSIERAGPVISLGYDCFFVSRSLHGVEKTFTANIRINEQYEPAMWRLRIHCNDPAGEGAYGLLYNSSEVLVTKSYYMQKEKTSLPSFYKHMLVDNYTEEQLTFGDEPLFKYKINLFSETKGLEKIIIPNVSITQSIFSEKRSCLFYLQHFVNFYSPKIKKQSNIGTKEWEYVNKYSLDLNLPGEEFNGECVDAIFGSTICPEMSLTNPTLRDVLSRIMIVKDCIPVVKDNVIYAMKIGETKDINTNFGEKFGGVFNYNADYMSFPTFSMNSGDYAVSARREYSNALSQDNSARYIEYLGFRNSSDALMTFDSLRIETRFPIYKINKLYLCYYKKAKITIVENNETKIENKVFICKHDITDLVLQNRVRNTLSADWTKYPEEINSRDDMSKYRILTLGYDIGGKIISGWGNKYSYISGVFGWFSRTKTYLENILDVIENYFYADETTTRAYIQQRLGMVGSNIFSAENQQGLIEVDDWLDSMIAFDQGGIEINGIEKIKTVFFEMDYNAMYNGAIEHSKNNVRVDDITTNDNCSSALTILEVDGLFEKEKMNRIGNKTFNLQGRYPSYAVMQENNNVLGSVYDDNIVIYHREYSIFNDYIQASFVGTYDYVLKNYFTTVFAKLRTYNFMSYEESTIRAENFKWFVDLSTLSCYYEYNDSNISVQNIVSAFNKSIEPAYYGDLKKPLLINGGFFTRQEKDENDDEITVKYYSDFNGFVSGYSLCFNIQMFDNVSHGVYISTMDTTITGEADAKGSVQEWYIATDTPNDAFIGEMGIFVGHFEKSDYFLEIPIIYDSSVEESIKQRFKDIYALPKAPTTELETVLIGSEKQINKDNKEILDVTFQFEPITYDEDIFFSPWLMKLSDLSTNYLKFDKEVSVYDFFGFSDASSGEKIQFFYTTGIPLGSSFGMNAPEIIIRCPSNLEIEKDSIFQLTSTNQQGWQTRRRTGTFFLYLNPLSTVEVYENGDIKVAVQELFYKRQSIHDEKEFVNEVRRYVDFKLVVSIVDGEEVKDYHGRFESFESATDPWTNGKTRPNDLADLSISNSYIYNGYYADELYPTVTYPQTMFIVDSNKKLQQELAYQELDLEDIPSGIKIIEVENFNDVFNIEEDPNGSPYIKVDSTKIVSQRTEDSKSLQYWFKDSDGKLKFVFGVNLSYVEQDKKVYLSLLSKRSIKVYDANHNYVANVENYVDNGEYGIAQKYEELTEEE